MRGTKRHDPPRGSGGRAKKTREDDDVDPFFERDPKEVTSDDGEEVEDETVEEKKLRIGRCASRT